MMKKTLKELREQMTMKEIAAFALEWGVKVDKKGSKTSAIGKIEAYCPEAILHINKTETTETATETTETATEKKGRKRTKKTFEELVAEIPAIADVIFVRARNNDVIVKRGKKRIFRYNGHTMIATSEKMFKGCDYEKQNWNGYVIHNVTTEVMKKVFANA